MLGQHFNEESDYSEENTCDNKVFCSTILQPFQFEPEQKKTCGNESHERETKLIHASYILQQEISIGANVDIQKAKREKQIAFVVERWMPCLLLRLKSWSAWEKFRHPAFMGNCPTISPHVSLIYLVDEIFLFLVYLNEMRTLAEYDFVSLRFLVLIKWNEGGESRISFCYLRVLRASPQTCHKRSGVIQCVQSACR